MLTSCPPLYEYTYTPLDKIASSDCYQVNVYGIVKFCTSVREPSRGTSCYITVSLHNEALRTTHSRFTVTIFGTSKNSLPRCNVGDVLRLHNVKVEHFNGKVNGKLQTFHKGEWLLFDKENESNKWTDSSCEQPTWTEEDCIIVTQMKEWANTVETEHNSPQPGCETRPPGEQETRPLCEQKTRPPGEQETCPLFEQKTCPPGEQETRPLGEQKTRPLSEQETRPPGEQTTRPHGELEEKTELMFAKVQAKQEVNTPAYNVLVRKDDGVLDLLSVTSAQCNAMLHNTDIPTVVMETKLLVNGLTHLNIPEIKGLLESCAFHQMPFHCRTTCHILPTFRYKQLKWTSCSCGTANGQVVEFCLRHTNNSCMVTASAYLQQLFAGSSGCETPPDSLKLLSSVLPTVEVDRSELTPAYVHCADVVVQLLRQTLTICHTRFSLL